MNAPLRGKLALIAALLSAAAALGEPVVWDGGAGSDDWNMAANWNPYQVPGDATGDSTTIGAAGASVTMSASGVSQHLFISGTGTTAPTLNITRDLTLAPSRNIHVGSHVTLPDYRGVVNHTSGKVIANRVCTAAQNRVANSRGAYNFGGGSAAAPVLMLANSLLIGNSTGENGLVSLSGHGTLTVKGGATMPNAIAMSQNGGIAEFRIRGGNLSITAGGGMRLATGGNGGSAKITAVLTETGFSPIHLTGASGAVHFDDGISSNDTLFDLQVDGFVGTPGQQIMVINASQPFTGHGRFGNVTDGQVISAGGYRFRASYDATNHDFCLTVVDTPNANAAIGSAPEVRQRADGAICLLPVREAIVGRDLQVLGDPPAFSRWTNPADHLRWKVAVSRPKTFNLVMTYSCEQGSEGSEFSVALGESVIKSKVQSTGRWDAYREFTIARVTFEGAGELPLVVRVVPKPGTAAMNLRALALVATD